jgi:hypothetical protein
MKKLSKKSRNIFSKEEKKTCLTKNEKKLIKEGKRDYEIIFIPISGLEVFLYKMGCHT